MATIKIFRWVRKSMKRRGFKLYNQHMVQKLELVQKKADGAVITVTTQENAIKKKFGKSFATPFD